MKGVNDDELPAFLRFAADNALDMRFIEFMPVGLETGWKGDAVWTAEEILAQASELTELVPAEPADGCRSGPARMFSLSGGAGRIGLISPYSDHFCDSCNRLRLTASGNLRTCLFSDKVYRLRPALRHPALGLKAVERIIRQASRHKPMGHRLLERMAAGPGVCRTRMASIGG